MLRAAPMHVGRACLASVLVALYSVWSAEARAEEDGGAEDAGVVDAGGEPAEAAQEPKSDAARLTPPRLLDSPPPVFPAQKLASGEHPTVVLNVTVFADGTLGDVSVEHSAGPLFDRAAIEAVQHWRFAPALRGDVPIASRVGVAVHFELPQLGVHEVTALSQPSPAVPHSHAAAAETRSPPPEGAEGEEVQTRAAVAGVARTEQRSASDYRLSREQLTSTQSQEGSDLLKRAPGIVVSRIEGDAVATRLMLRGFDADHGQDIALSADGVPINQPSHIHGQGYADLGFIIPETVRGLRVTEGVYDPRQGDFAVAGSADFELGVEKRGLRFSSSYGSFRTFRELALYAPQGFSNDTFGAAVFKKTQGFGQNRESTQGSAVAQLGWDSKRVHFTLHGSFHAARASTANVVRRDDIRSGRVGFYDVYPLATAEAQGASAQRGQVSLRALYKGARGENAEALVYFVQNDFRLQANYTGFTQVSRTNPAWAGRGDLIEQQNQDRSIGLRARYRAPEYRPFAWARAFLEVGVSGRLNAIGQRQNLLAAPDNTTWDERIDADISALDVGGYLDADLTLGSRVHVRGGVRTDLLSYRIEDRLANYVPSFREETYIPGYRRSAAGLAVGPRVVVSVDVAPGLSALSAYGEGYRSPMALLLDDGEPAPFTKVRSGDLGLRYVLHEQLELRASGFVTRLGNDVAFDPAEGRVTQVGPSLRTGFAAYAQARPLSFALLSLSTTYVHAQLQQPPYASAEDPDPPFRKGQLLPYVPQVVVRADLNLSHALAVVRSHELSGRIGGGYSYWSPRPLPYGGRAAPVSLVDAEAALTYRAFRLSLSCFNLLNQKYAAMELSYASNWNPDGFPSRLPARHVMAGAPRTLLLTLEVSL